MPEISYGGTLTFNPNYSIERKRKLIDEFPKRLASHLNYNVRVKMEDGQRQIIIPDVNYYLAVAIEYHKVDGEDDLEAPHIHFILYSEKVLPMYRVRAISAMLKEVYGRSQFYRMTEMKTASYSRYILKDSDRLTEKLGYPHYYEMNLEQSLEDFDWDIEDEYYDEF